jgi:transcriptional regulator with XRE-family HTH domain
MSFGESIREARRQRELSQMDLASKVGVTQATISNWERGVGEPDAAWRSKLEVVLGPLDDIASNTAMTTEEEVEGLDVEGAATFGDYPLDSLMIRHESRTVHDVLRRIEKDQYVLDPDFQRAFVWDTVRQSRLIESVLLRIPLPVLYLAENPDGKLVVVDGLQRLTTFQRFVNNKLRLDLENRELNGKRFRELEMRLQNRIEDTNLILYVVDAKVPERVRLDIFERVNGGVPLTRQQMRNCLYNGSGTRLLRDCVALPSFAQLFSGQAHRVMQNTMRDRELVNRYAAFRVLGWEAYRGDMDQFLGDVLTRMNSFTEEERAGITREFEDGIENNVFLFERMAFRRHVDGETKGSRFNVALFDVYSTTLGRYSQDRVKAAREALRAVFFSLMDDASFTAAIAYGTNQTDRVRTRFRRVIDSVREVLGDP